MQYFCFTAPLYFCFSAKIYLITYNMREPIKGLFTRVRHKGGIAPASSLGDTKRECFNGKSFIKHLVKSTR